MRLEVSLRLFFSVAIFRGKVFLVLFAVNVCRYFPHLVALNAATSHISWPSTLLFRGGFQVNKQRTLRTKSGSVGEVVSVFHFRPMDIICDNEYWSVMLCCLIPLSRWRASKSEREDGKRAL